MGQKFRGRAGSTSTSTISDLRAPKS